MSQLKRSPKEQTRILIVDDQPDNIKLLSLILTLNGYEVAECNRGKLAVDLATKNSPDLILLDISMPDLDGFKVCQLLKSDRRTENIPIIFISAFQKVEEKTQAFNLGGNDYITKPFQMEEVIARVETQLKYYRLQTELKIKNQQLKQEIEARQVAETKLLKINQQLSKLATIDSLTNIANRYYFDAFLTRQWKLARREQFPLAVILVDVDYFKLYNDRFGHQQGDICLQQIAQALLKAVKRPTDLVARYGGEEFAIILPRTSAHNALQVAEEIRQQIKILALTHPDSLAGDYVSLSLGVCAVVPSPKYTQQQLLVTADQALYQAKEQGRDRALVKFID
ncbi:diguanylate cyclase response regulator [Pleurocapsa sp. CCALA 161]|uniref:diguanylate cyclase domain-containing protein n=1 Tax=Pleurocapsa sp. CCALA 161 TaxID=2107688 RepID=UPI000D066152|nr:diguanylate cyclase [Pleurocapsa sp. CCALA 161]PSB05914.1 diguanylate cyclase response regulator [Pleurocapsa sp. CCALA 161]